MGHITFNWPTLERGLITYLYKKEEITFEGRFEEIKSDTIRIKNIIPDNFVLSEIDNEQSIVENYSKAKNFLDVSLRKIHSTLYILSFRLYVIPIKTSNEIVYTPEYYWVKKDKEGHVIEEERIDIASQSKSINVKEPVYKEDKNKFSVEIEIPKKIETSRRIIAKVKIHYDIDLPIERFVIKNSFGPLSRIAAIYPPSNIGQFVMILPSNDFIIDKNIGNYFEMHLDINDAGSILYNQKIDLKPSWDFTAYAVIEKKYDPQKYIVYRYKSSLSTEIIPKVSTSARISLLEPKGKNEFYVGEQLTLAFSASANVNIKELKIYDILPKGIELRELQSDRPVYISFIDEEQKLLKLSKPPEIRGLNKVTLIYSAKLTEEGTFKIKPKVEFLYPQINFIEDSQNEITLKVIRARPNIIPEIIKRCSRKGDNLFSVKIRFTNSSRLVASNLSIDSFESEDLALECVLHKNKEVTNPVASKLEPNEQTEIELQLRPVKGVLQEKEELRGVLSFSWEDSFGNHYSKSIDVSCPTKGILLPELEKFFDNIEIERKDAIKIMKLLLEIIKRTK